MKKIITLLLIMTICFSAFAYQNVYRLSSDEVQTFLTLRRASETMTPDPTYPVSASQLADLVKSLDTSKLSGKYLDLYNDLLNSLEKPQVLFGKDKVGLNVSAEILGAQYFASINQPTTSILPYKDRLPFADFVNDIYFKDYFFGRFNLNVSTLFSDYRANKNLITLKDVMNFSDGYPSNAYASFGFDNFSFIIGRERLGAGNGFTGNLELGENTYFDDFAKLSFVNDLLSYDFTINSFNHDLKGSQAKKIHADSSLDGMKKNVFIHRFSFNFSDKVSVSAYEGAMIYADSIFKDIKYFNPFMFMHNTCTYWDASTNNFFGIEATAMVGKNFQINGQFFLDQICIPFIEVDQNLSGDNAFALLLNISSSKQLGDGIFDYFAECVYGNPYVYLKNKHTYGVSYDTTKEYLDNDSYDCTNFDLVFDAYTDINRPGSVDKQFMGYKDGGDVLTIAGGASYIISNFKFTGSLQFTSKGIYGLGDNEIRLAQDAVEVKQNSLIASLGASCKLLEGINISAKAMAFIANNYQHIAGNKMKDFQFSIGLSLKPLDFFNIRKTI